MDEIRQQIQDSSKKIKKLGESAQAITEVTQIIQHVTRKINILALNAAIQAASAGDAGREFTIVASEVQRLAVDSSLATDKIEALIKTIQQDTAAAVSSMEKTTHEVVAGAHLTDQAGQALQSINGLSIFVAEQVGRASSKLEDKSDEMAAISLEMRSLQDITQETSRIVTETASQVEGLKAISDELSKTVRGYRVLEAE